jgi:hypothetical protein
MNEDLDDEPPWVMNELDLDDDHEDLDDDEPWRMMDEDLDDDDC